MRISTTEELFESLPRWDGTAKGAIYKHPKSDCDHWDMRQDEDGTVYYRNYDNPRKVNVWCSGARLSSHLHHLYQIQNRNPR